MARRLHLDFETFSEVDLRKAGAHVYAAHPSTEVLMLAYGWATDEVRLWVPAEGEPMPPDLTDALADPEVLLYAWNAAFERLIFRDTLGMEIPTERWRCVMVHAMTLSLPGRLSLAGAVVGVASDKQKMARGTRLVSKFCKPRKPTKSRPHTRATRETDPEDWEDFKAYCVRDVEAERAVYRRIKAWPVPPDEIRLWFLDQEINDRGIPINLRAVRQARRTTAEAIRRDLKQMEKITGLPNPNSTSQLLPWLRRAGYPFMDLKKGHVDRGEKMAREWFETDLGEFLGVNPALPEVLRLRARTSKSSVKKFAAFEAGTSPEGDGSFGRACGCLQFAGAGRTWRWAGRRVQVQNLARPVKRLEKDIPAMVRDVEALDLDLLELTWGDVMEVLVAAIRPMIQAPDGYLLVDADLHAIENVVLGWLADDQRILEVFWNDRDPYIDFAQYMFGKTYDTIAAAVASGDKSMRTTAKPGVLGCLGGDTLVLTSRGWVPLESVRTDDMVHDGVEWVAHAGLVARGEREVVDLGGVYATPDHEFLVGDDAWLEAEDLDCRSLQAAIALAASRLSDTSKTDPRLARFTSSVVTAALFPRSAEPGSRPHASTACSLRNTAIQGRSRGKPAPAFPPKTSSRIRPVVGVRTVFDIAGAGPRHRFVIWSAAGPLIAHNCGYLLGPGEARENPKTGEIEATGLLGYAWAMGVPMTPELAKLSVDTFRSTFLGVKQFWGDLDRAARRCITTGRSQRVGRLKFRMSPPFMQIVLPSGHALSYCRPRIMKRRAPWGDMVDAITYENMEDGHWRRVSTHKGKITENVVQAVARDLLAHAMVLAKARGLDIRFHVHDQVVALSPSHRAEEDLAVLLDCLTTRPGWGDDKLPLKAAGFTSKVFIKD